LRARSVGSPASATSPCASERTTSSRPSARKAPRAAPHRAFASASRSGSSTRFS
jgi:hypothetical protein